MEQIVMLEVFPRERLRRREIRHIDIGWKVHLAEVCSQNLWSLNQHDRHCTQRYLVENRAPEISPIDNRECKFRQITTSRAHRPTAMPAGGKPMELSPGTVPQQLHKNSSISVLEKGDRYVLKFPNFHRVVENVSRYQNSDRDLAERRGWGFKFGR
jgi:hypothetical protein